MLSRPFVAAATAVLLCALLAPGSAAAADCLLPPVDAPVDRGFEAPPCPYCAGHRGITFVVAPGTTVRAAAAGVVTFSGVVVDTRYVVVRHGDGLLATYGGLASSPRVAGDRVAAGAIVGRTGEGLYFGLRTAPRTYIDPQPLLGELVVPPYLVPTDGTPRRPPPTPQLSCARPHRTNDLDRSATRPRQLDRQPVAVHRRQRPVGSMRLIVR